MTVKINIIDTAKKAGIPGDCDIIGSRPYGRKTKETLIDIILNQNNLELVQLDFYGMKICDYSFVDEVIIETQLYLKEHTAIVMLVINMSDTVIGNLRAALALREKQGLKIPILCRSSDQFLFVGSMEENLQLTFNIVVERKSVTAREIADVFNIQINSASNRLKKLYDYRMLLRSEHIDATGKQHLYFLPRCIS